MTQGAQLPRVSGKLKTRHEPTLRAERENEAELNKWEAADQSPTQ